MELFYRNQIVRFTEGNLGLVPWGFSRFSSEHIADEGMLGFYQEPNDTPALSDWHNVLVVIDGARYVCPIHSSMFTSKVITADFSVDDLGHVAYHHPSPMTREVFLRSLYGRLIYLKRMDEAEKAYNDLGALMRENRTVS